jgi:hypothetical protein
MQNWVPIDPIGFVEQLLCWLVGWLVGWLDSANVGPNRLSWELNMWPEIWRHFAILVGDKKGGLFSGLMHHTPSYPNQPQRPTPHTRPYPIHPSNLRPYMVHGMVPYHQKRHPTLIQSDPIRDSVGMTWRAASRPQASDSIVACDRQWRGWYLISDIWNLTART